jgi:hypothetical protein
MAGGLNNQNFVINTQLASVTIRGNMFDDKDLKNHDTMGISISNADKAKLKKDLLDRIGSRPVIELAALADGKPISWNNENAPVTVALDYTPTAEELLDPDHIVVWYIDGNGRAVEVPSGRYDPETGKVIFTVTHFSTYAVAYSEKTFSDIGNAYGRKQIEALASKGFYSWINVSKFYPDRSITRAEFIYLVMTALDLHAGFDSNFSDVAATDFYYQAAGAAKKLGICDGIGGNKLGASLFITRQDMSKILYNALKAAKKGYSDGSVQDLKTFKDYPRISSYAYEGLSALVKAKVLIGYDNNLDPLGNLSMQQAAVIIYRIY